MGKLKVEMDTPLCKHTQGGEESQLGADARRFKTTQLSAFICVRSAAIICFFQQPVSLALAKLGGSGALADRDRQRRVTRLSRCMAHEVCETAVRRRARWCINEGTAIAKDDAIAGSNPLINNPSQP